MKKKIVSMLMVLCMMVSESMYIFAENEGETFDPAVSSQELTVTETTDNVASQEINVEIEKVMEDTQPIENSEQIDDSNSVEENLNEESINSDNFDDKESQGQQNIESSTDFVDQNQSEDPLDKSENIAADELDILESNVWNIGVPIIATGIYSYPTSFVANMQTVYTSGALEAASTGVEEVWDQLTRIPVESFDENWNRLTKTKAIAVGSRYVLMLKEDGTVWGAGYNEYSKIGTGDGDFRKLAVQVKGPEGNGYLSNVKNISAGTRHSIAVKNDGTVWAWGHVI